MDEYRSKQMLKFSTILAGAEETDMIPRDSWQLTVIKLINSGLLCLVAISWQ